MSAAFWAIALRPMFRAASTVQPEMPVLHQHVGRHHGPPVVRWPPPPHAPVRASPQRAGAAAHQAIEMAELADLLQRLGLLVAHATSSGGCRPVN